MNKVKEKVQYIDRSPHILVSVDMGQGRIIQKTLVSGIDILDSLVSNGLLPGQDLATALDRMGGIHPNTLMGGLYNIMVTNNKTRLHEVNRYYMPVESEQTLQKKGVRFNKVGGRGTGNKDYRPMYDVDIVKEIFRARILQAIEGAKKFAQFDPNIEQTMSVWKNRLMKIDTYDWQGKTVRALDVVVFPHATVKEERRRNKDVSKRRRPEIKTLI
jgi:hypothetical protein|nr:MAG TPA_asm: hypothetical protein [Caudoviricetes sp.]